MRSRTPTIAVSLASAILAAFASPAFADGPLVGFNQGWLPGKFNTSLTWEFDEAAWRQVFERTRAAGGSVVRIWLFQGQSAQGVIWDGNDIHRPAGVEPTLLKNVRRLAAIAEEEHVQIYWTAQDANFPLYWDKNQKLDFERAWNIDTDKYGFGKAFDENVLGPVVDAIMERPNAVYGLDLLNEAEGMVEKHAFPNGWKGARALIARETAFVHKRAPGLKVSASAGWATAEDDILSGKFDKLGLDFLDVHVYTDGTTIPKGDCLAAHARAQNVPIVLGEFAQESELLDPITQTKVAQGLLADAARLGFAAALAWQLEDADQRLTLYDRDTPRPAVAAIAQFAKDHPPAPPAPAPSPTPTPPPSAPTETRTGLVQAVDRAAEPQGAK
jgi:hypothetical protein